MGKKRKEKGEEDKRRKEKDTGEGWGERLPEFGLILGN